MHTLPSYMNTHYLLLFRSSVFGAMLHVSSKLYFQCHAWGIEGGDG